MQQSYLADYINRISGVEHDEVMNALRDILGSGDTLFDSSNVPVSHTGDTVETEVAGVDLPSLQENDVIRFMSLWSTPGGSANNKTGRVRLGGLTGTQYMSITNTTQLSIWEIRTISNRNSVTSQIGRAISAGMGSSSGAVITSAIDTSISKRLSFTAQLALATESITLEQYYVELLRK